ncbi:hypothetical protein Ccrd_013857 [Cynara cardunculus var. scolymus]|uniref:Uncharacterized protein n=1 Tax=Cynara cardunculus var. scolymus TaxID=59895 RepID=A0A118K4N1_CYNCS|nr:hypothetical protein Ccrd_013857 [Cynara cardunculus var. scolymus]
MVIYRVRVSIEHSISRSEKPRRRSSGWCHCSLFSIVVVDVGDRYGSPNPAVVHLGWGGYRPALI